MQTKLDFSRFEFKYILRDRLRRDLEGELGYFMELDPFVSAARRQMYFVRSLYFDDAQLTSYYEKTDGVMVRSKYRLRTYTDKRDEGSSLFLEEKGRYNSLVYKHRVPLPWSLVDSLDEGAGRFIEELMRINAESPRAVVNRFLFDSLRRGLRPKALIDYERRPYVSRYAPDFRVTFDERLASTVSERVFNPQAARRRLTLPGYSIVEVKFGRHIPAWFHRLIQFYELRRISVSKYCKGMERLGLALNLE